MKTCTCVPIEYAPGIIREFVRDRECPVHGNPGASLDGYSNERQADVFERMLDDAQKTLTMAERN